MSSGSQFNSAEEYARANMRHQQASVRYDHFKAQRPQPRNLLAPPEAAAIGPMAEKPISPGKERWNVKVAADADRDTIKRDAIQDVTISDLLVTDRPAVLLLTGQNDAFINNRASVVEQTVYRLTNVEIIGIKEEADGDYHVVVRDDMNHQMIVEVPFGGNLPFVPATSVFVAEITAARKAFDGKFGPIEQGMRSVSQKATIVGVGFFDSVHGQTGVAANGIELHPVIGVQFL